MESVARRFLCLFTRFPKLRIGFSRTIMQQLTAAGLIQSKMNLAGNVNHGKVLTPAGHKMLDSVALAVRDDAIARHPGLSNY